MKIIVNYDFSQQELVGKNDVFDVAEGTKLGNLLRIVDAKIFDEGKNRGIDTTYKTTLAGDQFNGCVVFINGSAPEKMLENKLYDGDNIEFVYGFCGG